MTIFTMQNSDLFSTFGENNSDKYAAIGSTILTTASDANISNTIPSNAPTFVNPYPLIINEWSQGTNGGKEWVEFLILGDGSNPTVNIQNAVLADTNRGMARLRLSGSGFASLPVGTFLVIYNAGDPDDNLFPKTTFDPANGDYKLLIPSINATGDYAITAAPSTTGFNFWASGTTGGAFGNTNPGDVPVLMSEASGFFTADSTPSNYTTADALATFYNILPNNASIQTTPPSPSVGGIGGNGTFLYLGQDATGITTDNNWSKDTNNDPANGNSRTPGEPNAQVIITQTDGSTSVAEGGAVDQYTIFLSSQPTDNVSIVITPDAQLDLGSGQGTSITLTFTIKNWYQPQTVTVQAFDDSDAETAIHSGVITHTVTSNNPNSLYNSTNNVPFKINGALVTSSTLNVNVEDNENFTVVTSITPAEPNSTNAATVDFTVIFSDDVSGVDQTDFVLAPTNITEASIASVTPISGNTYTVTVNTGEGEGSLGLNLVDDNSINNNLNLALGGVAVNDGDFTGELYTIDTVSPVVGVTPFTTSDSTPPLTGVVDDPTATVTVSVNDTNYTATNDGDGTWTLPDDTIGSILTDGTYEVEVTATDSLGNFGTDASINELVINPAAPAVSVDSLSTNDSEPQITGTVDDTTAIVEVTVDGTSYSATNNGDGTWTLEDNLAPSLTEGIYEVEVTATDSLGNFGTDGTTNELIIEVNDTPSFTSPPITSATEDIPYTYNINITDPEAEDLLDITALTLPTWLNLIDNGDRTASLTGTPTSDDLGEQTVELEVQDASGNKSTQSFSIIVAGMSDDLLTSQTLSLKDNQVFEIVGNSSPAKLKFTLIENQAENVNEIGLFTVDDNEGSINGILPGKPGYLAQALNRGKVIFSALANPSGFANPTRILEGFDTGDRLGFYLVPNSSTDSVVTDLAAGKTPTKVFLGLVGANEGSLNYLQTSELDEKSINLNWEDQLGGGDADFNDLVMTVELTQESPRLGTKLQSQQKREIIDIRELRSQVSAELIVNSQAAFDNFVGLYWVDNQEGQVGQLLPGDDDYAKAAIQRSLWEFDRNGMSSVNLEPGAILVPYLIADATSDEFLAQNSSNQQETDISAYFPYLEANPDGIDHIRLLGDNTFGFEDLFGGGDQDFNDMVFQVNLTAI
ncbi:DUF4114 domain-containing protein [Lyngbya aestuarii]|uniref:DUF4114 domain-containing protein n=1 Tax=Lyngbya aestuarii TaxID=118322 RepID=UPI00403DE1B8